MDIAADNNTGLETLVAEVADDFRMRQKQGEKPDIEVYAARHPEAADILRKVLASLQLVGLADSVAPERPSEPPTEMGAGILGDFRLIREVGRGGMGVVYEAEQISLRRRVALKVLPFAATMDARQLQRFRNEALAAASLDHPNIVKVHAVGQERAVHFYAMQFIDGQTLAELIAAPSAGRAEQRKLPDSPLSPVLRGEGRIPRHRFPTPPPRMLTAPLNEPEASATVSRLRPSRTPPPLPPRPRKPRRATAPFSAAPPSGASRPPRRWTTPTS